MREGRVGEVFGFSSWVVILHDELQHFEATTDVQKTTSITFVVHVAGRKVLIGWRLLLCNRGLSWESLWSAENIVVIFLYKVFCSPIYVLLTFIFFIEFNWVPCNGFTVENFLVFRPVISSVGLLDSRLMWPVLEPRASTRSLYRFLGKRFVSPTHPPSQWFKWAPTKGQGNPTMWINVNSHEGE